MGASESSSSEDAGGSVVTIVSNQYGDSAIAVATLMAMLDTGDLILFSGTGWRAALIKFFTWCAYSHVAVVHRRVSSATGETVVCLWESAGHRDGLYCMLNATVKAGVRLVRLEDRLAEYFRHSGGAPVRVCIIKLRARVATPEVEHALRQSLSDALARFEAHACGMPYAIPSSANVLRELYPSLFGSISTSASADAVRQHHHDVFGSFMCSELVATTLIYVHLLRNSVPIREILPKHFLNGALLQRFHPAAAASSGDDTLTFYEPVNYHFDVSPNVAPIPLLPSPSPAIESPAPFTFDTRGGPDVTPGQQQQQLQPMQHYYTYAQTLSAPAPQHQYQPYQSTPSAQAYYSSSSSPDTMVPYR